MAFFGLFGRPDINRLEGKLDMPGLFRALKHKDGRVRAEAMRALGRVVLSRGMMNGDAWGAIESAFKTDADPSVRSAAAEVLGGRGYPSDVDLLCAAAKTDLSAEVCDAAVEALASCGLGAVSELLELIHRSTATKRTKETAAKTLRRFQGEDAARHFVKLWLGWGWEYRNYQIPPGTEAVRETLVSLLANIQGEQSVEVLARIATQSGDIEAAPICEALVKTQRPEAFDALVSLWKAARADNRKVFIKALASSDDPRVLDLLVSILEQPEQYADSERHEAVVGLGNHLDNPRTFDLLALMLNRAEQEAGDYPLDSACPSLLARSGEIGIERLLMAMKSERPEVRCAIAVGLRSLAEDRVREAALISRVSDTLVSAQSDSSVEVRYAAASTLETLGLESDGPAERAVRAVLLERWDEIERLGEAGAVALAEHVKCGGWLRWDWGAQKSGFALIGKMGDVEICEPLTKIVAQHSNTHARDALVKVLSRVQLDQLSREFLFEMFRLQDKYFPDTSNDEWGNSGTFDCKEIRKAAKDELVRRGVNWWAK